VIAVLAVLLILVGLYSLFIAGVDCAGCILTGKEINHKVAFRVILGVLLNLLSALILYHA
jgi:hypothetical protein